jgi:hypothetical protein
MPGADRHRAGASAIWTLEEIATMIAAMMTAANLMGRDSLRLVPTRSGFEQLPELEGGAWPAAIGR